MDIIDFRYRPPYGSYRETIMYRDLERAKRCSEAFGMNQSPAVAARDMEASLTEMDRAGIGMAVLAVFMALPLLYVAVTAFKPYEELFLFPPRFFVKNPTMDNWANLMGAFDSSSVPFLKYLFNSLLLTGELTAHLTEIDRTASERVNRVVSEMAAAQGVNEALKERDPMAWVGAMNSLKAQAEEIVLSELVYA